MSFLAALASEHKNPLVADQGAYKRLFTPLTRGGSALLLPALNLWPKKQGKTALSGRRLETGVTATT